MDLIWSNGFTLFLLGSLPTVEFIAETFPKVSCMDSQFRIDCLIRLRRLLGICVEIIVCVCSLFSIWARSFTENTKCSRSNELFCICFSLNITKASQVFRKLLILTLCNVHNVLIASSDFPKWAFEFHSLSSKHFMTTFQHDDVDSFQFSDIVPAICVQMQASSVCRVDGGSTLWVFWKLVKVSASICKTSNNTRDHCTQKNFKCNWSRS